MNMVEALTKLANGDVGVVRPVKWDTEDKSFGALVFMPGYGNYRRIWSYTRTTDQTIPFVLDDPEIVRGEWEVVDSKTFFDKQ